MPYHVDYKFLIAHLEDSYSYTNYDFFKRIEMIKNFRSKIDPKISLKVAKNLCDWYTNTRKMVTYNYILQAEKKYLGVISVYCEEDIVIGNGPYYYKNDEPASLGDILKKADDPAEPYYVLYILSDNCTRVYKADTKEEALRVKKLMNDMGCSAKITQEI